MISDFLSAIVYLAFKFPFERLGIVVVLKIKFAVPYLIDQILMFCTRFSYVLSIIASTLILVY